MTALPPNPATAPPPALRWLMRGLAIGATALAGYLTWAHLSGQWAAGASSVPLCGGPSWLDCASVLNSRWATWFGLPVAAMAMGVYAAMTVATFSIGDRVSDGVRRVAWAVLLCGSVAAAMAAGWFIYVQAAVVGRWCTYCTFEHGLGLMLAGLVFIYAGATLRRATALVAVVVGIAGAGVLIAGQWLNAPRYTEPVAWSADDQTYREPVGDGADAVSLFEGRIVLNRAAHPRLGRPDASRYFVEVVDFTCYRCAETAPLIRDALEQLGPDAGILIVFSPLNADCNRHIPRTNPAYEHACDLARLAAAVWLADPSAYPAFHHWLMAEREGMTPDKARAHAARQVGSGALDEALADPRLDQLIARDVELTAMLDLRGLPGVVAADTRFNALPEDPKELARLIRKAWNAAPVKP